MNFQTHLFFLDNRYQISLDLIAQIVQECPAVKMVVVDVSSFNYPRLAPWSVPGIFGSRSIRVQQMFGQLGVTYVDAAKLRPREIRMTPHETRKIGIAIRSTIVSAYSKGVRRRRRQPLLERLLHNHLDSQSNRIFSLAIQLIRDFSAAQVYIANERFSAQHASYLGAQRESVQTIFYGVGESCGDRRYSLELFRSHDRVMSQRHALEVTSQLSEADLSKHARNQLDKHKANNTFDSLWSSSKNTWKGPRNSLVLFATSSSDETYSLDLNWNEADWSNQYEAFQFIWNKLKGRGLTPVLRVHPNLLNKSPSAAYSELKSIRRFQRENHEVVVVWPASPVSTYDLISYAEIVVVENSTVGLESSALGIPVICTNSSGYDLIADILTVHRREDLAKIDEMSMLPDPTGAFRMLAYNEITRVHLPRNELALELYPYSKIRTLLNSLLDGSFLSGVFEFRWKVYRLVLLFTFPR